MPSPAFQREGILTAVKEINGLRKNCARIYPRKERAEDEMWFSALDCASISARSSFICASRQFANEVARMESLGLFRT
jgi:hypothetical protein